MFAGYPVNSVITGGLFARPGAVCASTGVSTIKPLPIVVAETQ